MENSARQLTEFKAVSFDCYGTLIDWETGIWDALQPLLMHNRCSTVARLDGLEAFASAESAIEQAHPKLLYREILTRVHQAMAQQFGLTSTAAMDTAFGNSIPSWPAFPDTADALRFLKTRYKLIILSNVDRDSFAASNTRLGVTFDVVLTAEEIGSYKPALDNFRYMLKSLDEQFGFGKGDLLHTAQSLYHDHAPARHLGLSNAWIDRQKQSSEGGWGATAPLAKRPAVDYCWNSLAEMVAAVKHEETGGEPLF